MEHHSRFSVQFPRLFAHSDIIVAVSVVSVLTLMVLPLPTILLDLLLSFSITFSLVILLISMYVNRPLDLSSFPSILLIVTLFRLSLNISSTRIILLHGSEGPLAAGKVINAFGGFVVGGNYVVGAIVFLILVIVNYVVITKGAGRIAEVAARFTLDAMPGKQMSIDADLNAGFIDDQEAMERRRSIAREAEYYGAMDGANKFVKGDAIAGIIITLINIAAGFIIGVFQNGLSFAEAARTYTLLTVGDGLVTQIPALIVASAAGIVVTRAGSESGLGSEITSQLFYQPRAIAIASAVLLGLGLVPGLPTIPFFILSVLSGTAAWFLLKAQREDQLQEAEQRSAREQAHKTLPPSALPIPPLDILSLEIGYSLIPLVDKDQNGELLERIRHIRKQIGEELGIVVPPIHIQDNIRLKSGEYSIFLKGNQIGRGELIPNNLLAMNLDRRHQTLDGIATREPTYGLPAYWIKENEREQAISKGFTVVDPPTVLITHIADLIRRNADELLGRQEIKQLLDHFKVTHSAVVEELVPNVLTIGIIGKVLRNLLREQIPIRDMVTILETLADWGSSIKDADLLTEYVRQSLARTITAMYKNNDDSIPLLTIDQYVEQTIGEAVRRSEQGHSAALEPQIIQGIIHSITEHIERFAPLKQQPVIICSAAIRPHFKKLIERFIPNLVVLSYNEIMNHIKLKPLGSIGISNANKTL